MLRSVFPRAHRKYFSLPLLGPITDGFDDWLTACGFAQGSRTLAIHLLPIADKQLRRRGVDEVAKLNHAVLDDCCKALKKRYPCRAGTIHTLERYLVANGLIVDGRQAAATQPTSLSGEYAGHLREVRGFATSTVSSHRRTAQCFLQHLAAAGTALRRMRPCHVESYVAQAGKRLSRASLQHDIAALRGFLRFLATDGRAPRKGGAVMKGTSAFTPVFSSRLAPAFARYVDLKRALGRRFDLPARTLQSLDRFLCEQSAKYSDLNAAAFQAWCHTHEHVTSGVRRVRMLEARSFCLYRHRTEPQCFVPDSSFFPPYHQRLKPYIFSAAEVGKLLSAAAHARRLRPPGIDSAYSRDEVL